MILPPASACGVMEGIGLGARGSRLLSSSDTSDPSGFGLFSVRVDQNHFWVATWKAPGLGALFFEDGGVISFPRVASGVSGRGFAPSAIMPPECLPSPSEIGGTWVGVGAGNGGVISFPRVASGSREGGLPHRLSYHPSALFLLR